MLFNEKIEKYICLLNFSQDYIRMELIPFRYDGYLTSGKEKKIFIYD
jgi:hypothetical protein